MTLNKLHDSQQAKQIYGMRINESTSGWVSFPRWPEEWRELETQLVLSWSRESGEGISWRGISRRLRDGMWAEEVGSQVSVSQKKLDMKTLCWECCGSLPCSQGCSICGGYLWIRLLWQRGLRGCFKTVWVFFPVLMRIMTEMDWQ